MDSQRVGMNSQRSIPGDVVGKPHPARIQGPSGAHAHPDATKSHSSKHRQPLGVIAHTMPLSDLETEVGHLGVQTKFSADAWSDGGVDEASLFGSGRSAEV